MIDNAVSIRNMSFSYDKHNIYKDFSLDIKSNDITFLLGLNGSGKTTLLRLICSFLKPDQGEIIIGEKIQTAYDVKGLSRTIAYVPQILNLGSDFLVKDYIALGRTPYKGFCDSLNEDDYKLAEKYAKQLSILDLLESSFNTLSGGQKQTVTICRALVQETPIIIFDEPMSSLDLGKQADFLSLLLELKEQGKTVILTSHNLNHPLSIKKSCSVCLIDSHGNMSVGNCDDILSSENIKKLYGDKVIIDEKGVRFNI